MQFRFSGNIDYNNEAERLRVWKSLNPAAKSQFFYAPPEGQLALDSSTSGPYFKEEAARALSARDSGVPPDTFVVGVLVPDQVDFLNLNTLKRVNWKKKDMDQSSKGDKSCSYEWIETSGYAPPVVSTT